MSFLQIGFALPRESEQSLKSSSGPNSSRLSRLSASSDASSIVQVDRSVQRSRTSHNGVHLESGEVSITFGLSVLESDSLQG